MPVETIPIEQAPSEEAGEREEETEFVQEEAQKESVPGEVGKNMCGRPAGSKKSAQGEGSRAARG